MTRTVLYDSGSITQGAPYQQDVALSSNLSNYDIVRVVWGTNGDNEENSALIGVSAWFDIPYLLETGSNNMMLFTGYYCRWGLIKFTDTTFNFVGRGCDDEDGSRTPQIYKIYGYKF